tara:strand:+ start:442 stop:726 length:285 start_codon:yes stop_codon:yes gene_type:complete
MTKYLIFDSDNDGVLFLPVGAGVVPQYISATEVRIHLLPGSSGGTAIATLTCTGATLGFAGNVILSLQRLVDEPSLNYIQPDLITGMRITDWAL